VAESNALDVSAGAVFEYGVWYPRIDYMFNGERVGTPLIYRDQPHESSVEAIVAARKIARKLRGEADEQGLR
jgi:hypothetical protein